MIKKTKIICGGAGSGKTFLARELAGLYSDPVFLTAMDIPDHDYGYFQSLALNPYTDLIVFEACSQLNYMECRLLSAEGGIQVNQKHRSPFWISPDLIFITQERPSVEFYADPRFQIIELGAAKFCSGNSCVSKNYFSNQFFGRFLSKVFGIN